MPPVLIGKEPPKSWKKINEERKALKKQRKQEKLLKDLDKNSQSVLEGAKANDEGKDNIKADPSTISIAVPGSILENAQSAELRSYVAGQIARAACIFRVHEVIVFDDVGVATARETKRNYDSDDGEEKANGGDSRPPTVRSSCLQLARILQYLECPQYLRKFFFPLHKDLKYSGLLNPLDTPHHLRQQNVFLYREGIISDKKAKDGHSYVNVGLLNDVLVNKAIEPGVRVTVKLDNVKDNNKKLRGKIVSPEEPRRETGIYWGYSVRIAHSLAEIFTRGPFAGGYDLTIGTSDRGTNVHEVPNRSYKFNHLLIVFGGLKGLEEALANDEKLNVDDPALLFDHYVNVLPRQGSRTIRTEEALLIALAALQEKFEPSVPEVEEKLDEYQLPRSDDTGIRPDVIKSNKKNKKRKFEEHVNSHEDNEEEHRKNIMESKTTLKNSRDENQRAPSEASMQFNNASSKIDDDFEVVPTNEIQSMVPTKDLGDLSRFD
ncbi:putative methyltransferase C9orf114 [Bactrocera neohumeralis]|uniref:putative methyltransferase C9orf114 n=1 Tax=Bactrocera tryoni TaxID=59916 RepID=UPI001A96DF38|nr:putative methyltransferase C9orf114 [Bactrocera tryoni]XP_050323936.1 putative methyltransferase C9orf114 [Bactrocera neohumeralis]